MLSKQIKTILRNNWIYYQGWKKEIIIIAFSRKERKNSSFTLLWLYSLDWIVVCGSGVAKK